MKLHFSKPETNNRLFTDLLVYSSVRVFSSTRKKKRNPHKNKLNLSCIAASGKNGGLLRNKRFSPAKKEANCLVQKLKLQGDKEKLISSQTYLKRKQASRKHHVSTQKVTT